jgi:hypothetical protein
MKTNDAPVSAILREMLQSKIYNTKINEVRIRLAWQKVVGEITARYTDSLVFKNGTLTVTLTSAPLRQDLVYKKMELIQALHAELNEQMIKTIEIY